MIMQDIMSKIVLSSEQNVEFTIETPISVVPFVERFNNNLAGWTAEIDVVLKSPFDICSAAFE
jgi:hypothetical protein